ncbi:hypothetical protein CSC71_09430 [Pseudoxanthomonas sangjuensis]|uniref:exo-beta-N-acetylmuramidase NamZ family protein n=1 Tax=Pseudoxanthomonas sangjuensis TaxID=1503750 RepID=UPI0013908CBA|nr:DUF1343 domain-containing protein [Pseudoxanthomonas sangjuensis]KAF1711891.1 hypothetical protein CSC71_09430 [Pseudoxanthomonas sangjuensis]
MLRYGRDILLCGLAMLALAAPLRAAGPRDAGPEPGIEVLLHERAGELHGKRIGLVTNMTGVDRELRSDIDLLAARKDFRLVALYGPEHGVRGDVQAGGHVDSSRDAATGLPVYSLYGKTREPTAEMLDGVDVLLFDIQDVGARYYTYPYTLANVLRAAKKRGIPVWVLDRPNPLGGEKVEGPVLDPEFSSFVGMFPIPVRHGMTIGELATLFNDEFGIGAELAVVKMRGWHRGDAEPGGTMPWVPPSPNMPTRDTALVYPGTALIEGTNVSEGRGTTRPFETIGAPFVDARQLAARLNALGLPGVRFRPTWFTPSFSKHKDVPCGGVQLHVFDRDAFQPFRTGVALVKTLHDLYPRDFRFQSGLPGASPDFFDKLAGNAWLKQAIERGDPLDAIEARWQPALEAFRRQRRRHLLYP